MKKIILGMRLAAACCAAAMVSFPGAARADTTYTFLHMQCEPQSKKATITVFDEKDEAGKARSETPAADTYYLNDIANSQNDVICDLGGKQTVSFITRQDIDHPRNNNLTIFLNHQYVSDWFSTEPQSIEVQALAESEYTIKTCPTDPGNKIECKTIRVKDAVTVDHGEAGYGR